MTASVTAAPESSLGARGSGLYAELTASWTPSPLHRELLIEACRIVDRLERLDRQLRGEDWLRFRTSPDEPLVTVYVDKVLSEAREQENTLKALVLELAKVASQKQPGQKGGGVLGAIADELAAKRRAHTAS